MALTSEFAAIAKHEHRAAETSDFTGYKIVPARHPARFAGTIFAAAVIASIIYSTSTNPRWAKRKASVMAGSMVAR